MCRGALSWLHVQHSKSTNERPSSYFYKHSCVYLTMSLCKSFNVALGLFWESILFKAAALFLVVLSHDWTLWLETNGMRLPICSNKFVSVFVLSLGTHRVIIDFFPHCLSELRYHLHLSWKQIQSLITYSYLHSHYCTSSSCWLQYTICLEGPSNTVQTEILVESHNQSVLYNFCIIYWNCKCFWSCVLLHALQHYYIVSLVYLHPDKTLKTTTWEFLSRMAQPPFQNCDKAVPSFPHISFLPNDFAALWNIRAH